MEVFSSLVPLIEFAYNNNYHSSIGMSLFEVLYGKPCQIPLCWIRGRRENFRRSIVGGQDDTKHTSDQEKIESCTWSIEEHCKQTFGRSSVHCRRLYVPEAITVERCCSFQKREARKKEKLSPHYIGLCQIIKRVKGIHHTPEHIYTCQLHVITSLPSRYQPTYLSFDDHVDIEIEVCQLTCIFTKKNFLKHFHQKCFHQTLSTIA